MTPCDKETEPGDVFDLDLLVSAHPDAVRPGDVPPELAAKAVDAAFAIPFEAYEELVVDYLEDEFVEICSSEGGSSVMA